MKLVTKCEKSFAVTLFRKLVLDFCDSKRVPKAACYPKICFKVCHEWIIEKIDQ
jgi:hypothetical protein